MKWILLIAVVLIQGAGCFAQDKEPSLRALIIYDSSPSDLKDSYSVDAQRMSKSLESIAYHTKLAFRLKVCKEKNLSLKFLKQWLRGIPSSSQDVVFVYYAGRGSCVSNTDSDWPSIKVSGRCSGSSYAEDVIAKMIQTKNPRLCFVMFDCYQRLLSISRKKLYIPRCIRKTPGNGGFKRLFLKTKGVITACSARTGQPAYGIFQKGYTGGLFTSVFIGVMQLANVSPARWETIFSEIEDSCFDHPSVKQCSFNQLDVKEHRPRLIRMD